MRRAPAGPITRLVVAAAAVAALTAAAAVAQEQDPVGAGEAPPGLSARLDTTATTIGGPLDLTLEVDGSPGWVVAAPTKALDLGAFRVRSVEQLTRAGGPAWRLRIVPLEPGEIEVPPVTLTAHGPEGRTENVATDPLPVTVTSNLPPPDASEGTEQGAAVEPAPADLKPALEARRNRTPLIVAVVALAVAAALGFWLLRKLRARPAAEEAPVRGPKKALRPAWETALEELDRISAADYVAHGEIGRQYVEVTGALRQYLEDRYGVPALESTTADLDRHLLRTPIRREMSVRILSLLREADLVKFAKARPEPGAARATEGRVRDVVLKTVPEASPSEGNGGSP